MHTHWGTVTVGGVPEVQHALVAPHMLVLMLLQCYTRALKRRRWRISVARVQRDNKRLAISVL